MGIWKNWKIKKDCSWPEGCEWFFMDVDLSIHFNVEELGEREIMSCMIFQKCTFRLVGKTVFQYVLHGMLNNEKF